MSRAVPSGAPWPYLRLKKAGRILGVDSLRLLALTTQRHRDGSFRIRSVQLLGHGGEPLTLVNKADVLAVAAEVAS